MAFAEAGERVVGLDLDPAKIEALNAGRSYIEDVPSASIERLVEAGTFTAGDDYSALADCEAVVVCVPTPLTNSREPDLQYLEASADALAQQVRPGGLVVLESTTYPGSTRELLAERIAAGGLVAGQDFHLAFSPERIDPGRTDHTLRTTPKLVGGLTPACAERARQLYERICDEVIVLSSPEAAEMAKLLENIFRSVNIALVNELGQLCERLGVDVWEVVEAAATKPFGFMRFDPGPGMGGHCLPVDPFYLAFKAREHDFYPEFIELAGKINQSQPLWCVRRIEGALNEAELAVKGSRILILGVGYKGGVGDTRESPALKIIALLRDLGAEVSYHDPHVPALPEFGLESVDLEPAVAATDLLAIVTAHPEIDHPAIAAKASRTIDFRGVTRGHPVPNLTLL